MEPPDALQRYRPLVIQEMRRVLEGRRLPIYDMARYHLGWVNAEGVPSEEEGGKGLRPALCLLTADALDGSEAGRQRALAGAAAVEFVHNYSLVHDDIQDRDRERHHRPTVWALWGDGQAINAGDALRELAQHALARAREAGASAESVLAAYAALSAAGLTMIEGQYLDLTFERRSDIGLDDSLDMIRRKTGAMIGVSLQLGALLSRGDAGIAAQLYRAGERLGLLFQVRDDHLGIWGESETTGKSTESDIRRRKKSWPVVYAFAEADGAAQRRLRAIYHQQELSDADVETVLGVLEAVGAREASARAAQQAYDAFRQELAGIALSAPARAAFTEVAEFFLRRDH